MLAGRSAQAAGGRNAIVTAVAVAFLLLLAGLAQAAVPVGSDFRVSSTGPDTSTARGAADNAVAYNSKDNEYLVVWYGDGEATDDEFEIYGQRVDAATGTKIGGTFRISNVPPVGDATRGALYPDVAYNSTDNQYLVAWQADGLASPGIDEEFEIFVQRLSAAGAELDTGTEVGTNDFRVSTVGTDGQICPAELPEHPDPFQPGAFRPALAYNSTDNEYVVTWSGDRVCGELEIFGQRLSAAGAEVGTNDFRISTTWTDGDTAHDAEFPAIAYNSLGNQYLVVWHGDGLATDGKVEVFGQRLGADGGEAGSDFQISTTGSATNTSRFADRPTVAYGSQPNEYLVAWEGNPLTQTGEVEIFGQRLSAGGTGVGSAVRISSVGTDDDQSRDGLSPAASYNPVINEYDVVWYGDGLAIDQEFEVFGQRLSGAGAELGGDYRVSTAGSDGDASRGAFFPTVAASTQADAGLVTWYGDGLATNDKFEVFAHRLGIPPSTPPPAPTPAPTGPTGASGAPTGLRLSVRAARFQRALRTKVLTLRVTCNVQCSVRAATRVSVPRTGASRTFKLRNVTSTLTASKTTTVRAKVSSKVIRAAKRALKKRKRVTATVTVRARDSSGASRSAKRSIRIRR